MSSVKNDFSLSVLFCFFSTAWNNSRQVMFDMNVLPGNRHIISWSLYEASSFLYDLSITLSDRNDWRLVWCCCVINNACLFLLWRMSSFTWWFPDVSRFSSFLFFAVWDLREHNTSDLCPRVPKWILRTGNWDNDWYWHKWTHSAPCWTTSYCTISTAYWHPSEHKHTNVVQKKRYLLLEN